MTRIWKFLVVLLLGGVLGTGFGFGLGIFAFPYLFPPPAGTDELTAEERTDLVAQGTFVHANPSDPIHYGKGRVSVYERTVFLEQDFQVGPGPAFHVYLVPRTAVRASDDVAETMYVDLGPLRAFEGAQKYTVPDGVSLVEFPSVVIWCEKFGVLISPADLIFAE
jgi:hypothetical protein